MERIWLKNYPAGVSADINPNTYQSIVEIFNRSCQKYGQKPAYSNLGHTITYHEVGQACQAFAAFLQQQLKLTKGTRFAIMLPNVLQYPIALFGALSAGLTVVNVNPLYTPPELIHQMNDAGAEAIIVLANFAHVLETALPKMPSVKHVIITELGDCMPSIKRVLVNFVVKKIKKMVPRFSIPQAIPFTSVISQGKKLTFNPVTVTSKDIAFLQYTGGTTGVAKGAILTHHNIVSNMLQVNAWIRTTLKEGQEVIITALPLYHIFSLLANGLVFMEFGALSVLITNPRDMNHFVKELRKFPFTAITGVNTLFNALLNNPDFAKLDFSHLRLALGGGMAVQRAVAERWQQVTGKPLLEAYGLTETSPAVTVNPLSLHGYNGSIGLPVPSTDISIRDDNDNELPLGQEGELCVKGPQVMAGYWNNPEETNKVLSADGWLKTGDMAKIDSEGYVYLVERKKDMILVSGFNVYPNEVEGVIASHPGVAEVGVIGVPDEVSGEVVKAVIVKKDPKLTAEDIVNFCRQQLTGYKIPKKIEFRSVLPKTNVGKILRRELRQQVVST